MIEIGPLYREIGELRAKIGHSSEPTLTRVEALRIVQAIEALACYLKRWVEAQGETEG